MTHVSEETLIAYHLGELSALERTLLRRRLERDPELAAASEEIAATLRAFSADSTPLATPQALDDALDRSWNRVRASATVLQPASRRHSAARWQLAFAGTAALLLGCVWIASTHRSAATPTIAGGAPVENVSVTPAPAAASWTHKLLAELHGRRHPARDILLNNRPGPLTTAPADAVADDPQLAAHLDTAERVLTEVSHADGPLPDQTRAQVHNLLLSNALYQRSAETRGDLATAAVIDDLGRVLISLDAEPPRSKDASPDALRLQVNLGGVLLDLRILHGSARQHAGQ